MANAWDNSECPVCATAEILCSKWTMLVIRDLVSERRRFCELERSLEGISPRTLSLRLRDLEQRGIVERRTFAEVPPRVEYGLTAKGLALVPIVEAMRAFGVEWLDARDRLCGVESVGASARGEAADTVELSSVGATHADRSVAGAVA